MEQNKEIKKALKSYLLGKKYYNDNTTKSFMYFQLSIKYLNKCKKKNDVNNKIQLVKAQDRSAQSSKWQEILDEILDWFVEKNINYKKVQPLFEMKITQDDLKKQKKPKGKGGRPPDPKLEEKKRRLNKEYYNLTKKNGFTKSKTMDILEKKYSWTKTTIETYLK